MRTDKQIAEYMAYYKDKPKDERKWALENLAKLEKKSPAEIRAICEKQAQRGKEKLCPEPEKTKSVCGRPSFTEEKKNEIKAELLAGGSLSSVAEECNVSTTTVGRIRVGLVKEGLLPSGRHSSPKKEEEPKPEEKTVADVEKSPEAYPGQIYDAEPIVEEDVKTYIPHENDFAGECSEQLEDDGADMFVLLDKMREWVEANFGEHIPIDMRCCNKTEGAQYHFRDPRTGKTYRISLYKQWEEDEEKEEE